MADPKYVRLREGVTACADVLGNSDFAVTGNDVVEFPEDREAKAFVRVKIREGVLEEASKAEFDDVQEANAVDLDGVVLAAVGHQEQELRDRSKAAGAKLVKTTEKRRRKDAGADEEELDEKEADAVETLQKTQQERARQANT